MDRTPSDDPAARRRAARLANGIVVGLGLIAAIPLVWPGAAPAPGLHRCGDALADALVATTDARLRWGLVAELVVIAVGWRGAPGWAWLPLGLAAGATAARLAATAIPAMLADCS